jgi:hypothetical protein
VRPQEIDSSVERFTLPEALQDTNEKLGENVQNIVRPLTDPTVRSLRVLESSSASSMCRSPALVLMLPYSSVTES